MKNQNRIFPTILLVCFAFSPLARAVVPAPDGGYAGSNTAEGQNALLSLNVNAGANNTAVGWFSLKSNVGGQFNTALGAATLFSNTAHRNTAIGGEAMFSNTIGLSNTATGMLSLFSNTIGSSNTALGDSALLNNTEGSNNTAVGVQALASNLSGSFNCAFGLGALGSSTGSHNTAIGHLAGADLTKGSGNVCIGTGVIGFEDESNTTRIRNIYSSTATTRAVYVNIDDKLGILFSSRRYKEEVRPMDRAREAIFGLKPVTFYYNKKVDRSHALSFGLIAEDVAEVRPDLITRDREGKPETVRYEAVNAMLLNEFLKEHKTVQEQGKTIVQLEKQIKALTAGLRKVSAQIQINKTPTVVCNNQ